MIDTLEPRRYLSVSLDSAGWTVVSPASDTKVIYVSSSGNDSNNGLSAGAPVKTLPVAQGLVRDGYADWILLKRGDTFGSFGQWNKKGRSAQEPLYIGAYGTATTTTDNRPIIDAGTGYGIITYGNGTGSTARRIDNLVISSLNFIASTYNGSNGTGDTAAIRLLCQGANVTIEDVRAAGFRDNIVIGTDGNGGNTNTVIRRSEIMDSKNFTPVQNGVNTYSQGIYLSPSCIDCVIEENFIDNNGTKTGDDPYNEHNIYVRNGAVRTIVRNNVSSRASFYGLKFNAGGTADNNLFIKNSESVYLESAATITNNVITESIDMPAATWGVGINTQYAPSATISGNLITNSLSTGAGGIAGIQIFNNGTAFTGTVTDNIVYKWRNPLLNYLAAVSPVGALQIRNNQFQTVFGDTGATEQRSAATQDRFVYSGNIYSSGTKTSVNNVTASRVYKTQTEWRALTGNNTETYATPAFPDPTRTIGALSDGSDRRARRRAMRTSPRDAP